MIGTDQHADLLISFYKRLVAGTVPAGVAGGLTVDLNKAITAGGVEIPEDEPDAKAERAAAAEAKAAKRREELARLEAGS